MRRVLWVLALLCLTACVGAAECVDDVDAQMAQLGIITQRAESIAKIKYNEGTVHKSGCMPVSLANGIAASFGVTDPETTEGLVRELITMLVPRWLKGKTGIELQDMPDVLNPALRMSEEETYPYLAKTVGAYPGDLIFMEKRMNAREALEHIDAAQAPFMLAGRMYLYPDWTEAVQIIMGLHERGMDDVTLCFACLGTGKKGSAAPLRLGSSGHYLSVFIHVGAFMENGAVYVLDSIPRALRDETISAGGDLREYYAFARERPTRKFNVRFYATRVSTTIIRLSLRPEMMETVYAGPEETELERRVELMSFLPLYGYSVAMISIPE